MKCTSCGASIDPGSKFCTKCGAPVPVNLKKETDSGPKYCASCGEKLPENVRYCPNCGAATDGTKTEAAEQTGKEPEAKPPGSKRPKWVIPAIAASAAGIVLAVALVSQALQGASFSSLWNTVVPAAMATEPQATEAAASSPSQVPTTVPTTAKPATPAPAAKAAAAAVGQPGETFSLTLAQSQALAEQVAEPLLDTEWEWVMDFEQDGGYYNADSWKNQPKIQVADLIGREEEDVNAFGPWRRGFWDTYAYWLAEADVVSYDNGYHNGRIFGSGSQIQDETAVISKAALEQYFDDAFNDADLAGAITEKYGPGSDFAAVNEYASEKYARDGSWHIGFGDPGSNACIEPPAAPLQVKNGQVMLQGEISGAWADWSYDEPVYWDITLDVRRDENSPYGCIVTGYSVTAEDHAVPATPEPTVKTNTPPPAQTPAARSFDANGLIFADSSERYLTDADLQGLSKEMLAFARNEIFARNGNLFRKDKYIDHYTSYDWYNDIPNKRHDIYEWELNPVEQANIKLIQRYEAA